MTKQCLWWIAHNTARPLLNAHTNCGSGIAQPEYEVTILNDKAVFQSRPENQTLLLIYNSYTNTFRGLMLLASRKQATLCIVCG